MRGYRSHLTYSLLALTLVSRGFTHADGFRISELSARGTGIGGALVAVPDEVTALEVNPGSLSFLRGTHLSLGATISLPEVSFTGVLPDAHSMKMQSQVLFPPNICLSHTFESGMGFGVSATAPYLTRADWGSDWVGSRIVANSEFRVIRVMPAASIRLTDRIALGVGISANVLRWVQSRVVDGTASSQLLQRWESDGAFCYGVQAGLLIRPHDWLSLGLTYESRTSFTVDNGNVTYQSLTPNSVADGMPTTFSGQVVLPEAVRGGIGLYPFEALAVVAELEFIRWSSLTPLTLRLEPTGEAVTDQSGWKDAFVGKAGMELEIQDVTLRIGVVIGGNPIPDSRLRPSIPAVGGTGFSLGVGYAVSERLRLDFAYERFGSIDRNVTDSEVGYLDGRPFTGMYTVASSVIGLNVSYSWNSE